MLRQISLEKVFEIARKKGYVIFEKGSWDLNLWLIRSKFTVAGSFDDIGLVFYKHNNSWACKAYSITTDPSDLSLIAPKNPSGTAIVKPNQYMGLWQFGLHKGKYEALVQKNPVSVIRDSNKDNILDIPLSDELARLQRIETFNGNIKQYSYYDQVSGKIRFREEVGIFGINYHRASLWQSLLKIGPYSEGCAVHQHPEAYTKSFIPIVKSASLICNSFSGTYVTEQDFSI